MNRLPPRQLNIVYAHRTRGVDVEGVHIRGITQAFIQQGHNVTFVAPPGTNTDYRNSKGKKKRFIRNFWRSFSQHCPQLFFEFLEPFLFL